MDEISAHLNDFRKTFPEILWVSQESYQKNPKDTKHLRKIFVYLLSSDLLLLDFNTPSELLHSPLPTAVNILQQIRDLDLAYYFP